MKGVDLSVWQKGMDLAKVKEAGYGFVILRGESLDIQDLGL